MSLFRLDKIPRNFRDLTRSVSFLYIFVRSSFNSLTFLANRTALHAPGSRLCLFLHNIQPFCLSRTTNSSAALSTRLIPAAISHFIAYRHWISRLCFPQNTLCAPLDGSSCITTQITPNHIPQRARSHQRRDRAANASLACGHAGWLVLRSTFCVRPPFFLLRLYPPDTPSS